MLVQSVAQHRRNLDLLLLLLFILAAVVVVLLLLLMLSLLLLTQSDQHLPRKHNLSLPFDVAVTLDIDRGHRNWHECVTGGY